MFYKACLGLTIGIAVLSLLSATFAQANTFTVRQQNYVDSRAERSSRTRIIVAPSGSTYNSGSSSTNRSSGGSSRNDYDGFSGGGTGTGK